MGPHRGSQVALKKEQNSDTVWDMVRPYEESHPWLRFHYDLRQLGWRDWLAIGEIRSKCEHLSWVPLRPETAAELHRLYFAKGVHATTAIEGNTLTEHEVRARLDGKAVSPPSKAYLEREIDNVARVCNAIMDEASIDGELTVSQILGYHRSLMEGLPAEPHVEPGKTRTYAVGVAAYRAAPAVDVDHLMERLVGWLNLPDFRPADGDRIAFGFLRAVLAHLYIAWIHPFGDGNGRTARLLEFYILVGAGVPSPAAHLLSNHYNETRAAYYRELDRASKTGDPTEFLRYAIQGMVDGLRRQVERIREQLVAVTWENFVHEAVPGTSERASRQRHLLIDLARASAPIAASRIIDLSTRVAAHYAQATSKTLHRDLNALVSAELLRREPGGYVANVDRLRPYLPRRAAAS